MNLKSEQLESINDILTNTMKHWDVPGVALAIITDDDIHTECHGYRNVEQEAAVTPSTVFPLASITKSFTAMGVGLLVDDGVLDWDDPVRKHLPDFRLYTEELTANVTVRDLLTHRTGLPRHEITAYNVPIKREELIYKLKYLKPSKALRETWQYQNFMFTTAGYLAGRLAGASWESFTQERILDPLELQNTMPGLGKFKKRRNRAIGYWQPKDELEPIEDYRDRTVVAPAGAIFSDIRDLTKWLQVQMGEGVYEDKSFIKPKTLAEMHTPQMLISTTESYRKLHQTPFFAYGLGWQIQPYQGKTLIRHGGNTTGFSTFAAFLPDEKLGIAVLCNHDGAYFRQALTYEIFDLLLEQPSREWIKRYATVEKEAKLEEKNKAEKSQKVRIEGTKPSHPIEDYLGIYEHSAYPQIILRKNDDGELEGKLINQYWALEHYHYDIFELDVYAYKWRPKLSFLTNHDGAISAFTFPVEPQLEPLEFKKVKE